MLLRSVCLHCQFSFARSNLNTSHAFFVTLGNLTLAKNLTRRTPLVTNLHALAVFKMAAPVVRICRRWICSQAKKTHVKRANPNIDRIVRVDHAGELGADRIYAGQMAILGRTSVGPTIQVRNLRYVRFCRVFSSFLYFFSLFPFRFLHSYSFLVDQDQGNPT